MFHKPFLCHAPIGACQECGAPHDGDCTLFVGASPGNFVNSIGQDNLAFACGFLEELGVPVGVGEQSGPAGCRIVLWPASGHETHKPLTRVKETKVRRIILPLVKPLNLTPAAA